jgi:hypothetical protein
MYPLKNNAAGTVMEIAMKRIVVSLMILIFIGLTYPAHLAGQQAGTQNDRPTIALVNRVVQIVERRSPEIEWRAAKIGDLLNSGDVIKTGPASFSLVRFYDNSLLRIRELTEIIVYADRDRSAYHRNIQVDRGGVGFDVRKQEADRFEFSTPTSVASIRGSSGSFTIVPGESDVLLMSTGRALLRNLLSGEELDVIGGEIAFSHSDGSLDKRSVNQDDLDRFGDESTEGAKERRKRILELRTKDEAGNPHKVIIEFEEDPPQR